MRCGSYARSCCTKVLKTGFLPLAFPHLHLEGPELSSVVRACDSVAGIVSRELRLFPENGHCFPKIGKECIVSRKSGKNGWPALLELNKDWSYLTNWLTGVLVFGARAPILSQFSGKNAFVSRELRLFPENGNCFPKIGKECMRARQTDHFRTVLEFVPKVGTHLWCCNNINLPHNLLEH